MNCPYCHYDLRLPKFKEGKRYVGIKCLHCPLLTQFTIDNQFQILLHSYIYLDECNSPNGRMILITPINNTLQLHRFDPHGDSYVILELNYIPQDFVPNNANEYWNRLMNIRVFE